VRRRLLDRDGTGQQSSDADASWQVASSPHMGHFCAIVLPRLGNAYTLAGVRFGGREMLTMVPMLLVLTVFAMPVALAFMATVGAWAERRSVY
jgi:hypothetical protein